MGAGKTIRESAERYGGPVQGHLEVIPSGPLGALLSAAKAKPRYPPDIIKRTKGGDVIVSAELLEDLEHGRGLTEAAISNRTRTAHACELKRFEA